MNQFSDLSIDFIQEVTWFCNSTYTQKGREPYLCFLFTYYTPLAEGGNHELLFWLLVALMLIIWLKWDLKLQIYRVLSVKNESAIGNLKLENTMGNLFFGFFKYWSKPLKKLEL